MKEASIVHPFLFQTIDYTKQVNCLSIISGVIFDIINEHDPPLSIAETWGRISWFERIKEQNAHGDSVEVDEEAEA
ncbi:hypothetical protein Prudu_020037 [Prunus dulcis]|uniref:Uncharacterized protein n=1 Tax=Prunus dulcis TaxID=3755 RepID=A0A4Y1RUD5_PRUDU|nr:hypothetical protein Prudu_020037 [Prunus dulcis]